MSFSVPTSPAVARSSKAQPVTPQRLSRHQPRSQSFYRSPLTPSSPFTPVSHRSLDSTGSSTLTTPDNAVGLKKRGSLVHGSPAVARNANTSKDKSLADIADNWRTRANESENNIKLPNAHEDESRYPDDDSSDMSLSDVANDSSILSSEEALLAAPFLATHRKLNSMPNFNRPRAQSHASLMPNRIQPLSPMTSRSVNRVPPQTASPFQSRRTMSVSNQSVNLMSTPPPNRTLARQLKLKGCLTDPAQPRRREAFVPVPTPTQNLSLRNMSMSLVHEPDVSFDLFDIDENDHEENDQQKSDFENSFTHNLPTNSFGYPQFPAPVPTGQPLLSHQAPFADPFHPNDALNGLCNPHLLNGFAESIEHHFHANRLPQQAFFDEMLHARRNMYNVIPQAHYGQLMPTNYPPAPFMPIPAPAFHSAQNRNVSNRTFSDCSSSSPTAKLPQLSPEPAPTDCSVCLLSNPTSLAILQPCRHPLCSACLTSALNIVGEKDMECAVCKQKVDDFKLVMNSRNKNAQQSLTPSQTPITSSPARSDIFAYDNSNDGLGELESAFEFGLGLGELRASTPKLEQDSSSSFLSIRKNEKRNLRKGEENVVLRIDNVPWDITPSQIIRWLQQPVERVHVLLDSKGKTMSHAYVEVKDAPTAGAILRGEASSPTGKKERGSVLGRGRRARGVTITRSGQQELMSDLFPNWRGGFDGSRPSLAGLEGDRIIVALENGLLSENEIAGLLHLMKEPDSHFLKVPCLPFHSLISLLSKFPADVDSRVFWSPNIRDSLFDTTFKAIKILLTRVQEAEAKAEKSTNFPEEYTRELVIDLLQCALDCKALTAHQIRQLLQLAEENGLPAPEHESEASMISSMDTRSHSDISLPLTPASHQSPSIPRPVFVKEDPAPPAKTESLDELAREFGVDAHVVQALAQRLGRLP
ncbi:hypothetical protein CVT24_007915 [Panaeolus cyanescens]|uniref:RING-type domain-containing protein n=1 Tax=Panaeolus cyanescens TaxID=181874 RepID=A0A409W0C4_9AGAR|nr:hypothetical protein CVT24_007915 [Panaeolus cyanescens]